MRLIREGYKTLEEASVLVEPGTLYVYNILSRLMTLYCLKHVMDHTHTGRLVIEFRLRVTSDGYVEVSAYRGETYDPEPYLLEQEQERRL